MLRIKYVIGSSFPLGSLDDTCSPTAVTLMPARLDGDTKAVPLMLPAFVLMLGVVSAVAVIGLRKSAEQPVGV